MSQDQDALLDQLGLVNTDYKIGSLEARGYFLQICEILLHRGTVDCHIEDVYGDTPRL